MRALWLVGLDLYEEMQNFYRDFYSANGMTLCVIGKESIPELEAIGTSAPFLVAPTIGTNALHAMLQAYATHLLGHEGGFLLATRAVCPHRQFQRGAWTEEEMQRLHRIQFKFMPDRQPFSLAASIAANLQVHPPSEVLSGPVLIYDLDPEASHGIVNRLTLDSVRVTHQAKVLEERCTDRDTSYDSPMKFEELPAAWRESWGKALNAGATAEEAVAAAKKLGLHLPAPNPFIPEDLDMKELKQPNPTLPRRLPGANVPAAQGQSRCIGIHPA
eukprot:Skav218663  [mRNA]  locus=scaffold365:863497:868753:- [translate_table: standard]